MTAPSLRIPAALRAPAALRSGAELVLGVALLTASAKLSVPFWPVPATVQTLAVLLVAGFQGRRALGTIGAYVALGVAGAPVFAAAAGLPALLGPTGGYLVGFLVAAALLARTGVPRSVPGAFAAFLAADGVILLCGVAWLATLVGPAHAVQAGLLPFIPGELTKVALATAAFSLRRRA